MTALFIKAHVGAYRRADGTPVAAYDTKAPAARLGTLHGHPLRDMVNAADRALHGPAEQAITGFIGVEPGTVDDPGGAGFGYMSARRLEDAYAEDASPEGLDARAEIDRAFAPIREALRAKLGDKVRLYRVQGKVAAPSANTINMSSTASGRRSLLSWSSDPKFVEDYAGVKKPRQLFTEDEIAAAEKAYAETGRAQITKHTSLRREIIKGYRQDNGEPFSVECCMIYQGEEQITDADGVREFMETLNEERAETNAASEAKRAKIVEADVPLDDVIWVSDRAGQSEFIVRNRGDHGLHPEEMAKAIAQDFMRLRDPGEPTDAQKAAGNYAKRAVPWRGLTISVENEAGDVRRGIEPSGHPWATRLLYAYGYIRGSMGVDGDQVDVYLGPDLDTAPMVYVVHQRRYGHWSEYDEDKCMLGFDSEQAASDAYLSCYDDPRFLGPITPMPATEFVTKVVATLDAPQMIKAMVAPYTREGSIVRGYDNHRRPAPKPAKQVDLFAAGGDQEFTRLDKLSNRVVRYASGMSRPGDFVPAAHAGHGVGVEAGELSAPAIAQLAQAVVDWKTQVFVDSGAFGRFISAVKAGCAPEVIDYAAQVFPVYDRLLDAIGDLNEAEERLPPLSLVMPDVVDDQIASLNLIASHAAYVRVTCDFSGMSRAIIPIQRGPLSMAEAYREIVRILGTDNFVCGIPSNAAAITPEEFTAFLAEAKPRGVHILGALHETRLRPRLRQILASGWEPEWVSADANPLRSQIIEHGQTRDERQAKIRERLGERTRLEELDAWMHHNGGLEGLQAAYTAAAPDRRARILGLLSDLSGMDLDRVRSHYQLKA